MASARLAKAESALRSYALSFPESYEEFPWGHRAIKVKGKAFVFSPKARVPLTILYTWIDESYRAIAPKTLVRSLPVW